MKQGNVKTLFQLLYLYRHGRLTDVQCLSGSGETAKAGYGVEDAYLVEVEFGVWREFQFLCTKVQL